MAEFQPDEGVVKKIVRLIEDVIQLGPDPTDFIELSDYIESTTGVLAILDMESTESVDQTAAVDPVAAVDTMVSVDPTMDIDDMNIDMETTVFVDQTVPVVATMDMETTVYVDQKSTVDSTVAGDQMADVDMTVVVDPTRNVTTNNILDPTISEDFSASIEPITILNPDKLPLTFKQIRKLIVRRLFAIECNPVQNYLMVIMKRSTIDKTTRLMSGWILNHHLNYYYETMPPAVISYLLKECLTLIGDISPRVRQCNFSLIMHLAFNSCHLWSEIFAAITEMLNSIEPNMYKGALDILQLIFNKVDFNDLPRKSIDILIRKLITLIGSPSLTKMSGSVSIIKELIVQNTSVFLDHCTVLIQNLLFLDNELLQNVNDENIKTLLRRNVCISISTLAQSRCLIIDENTHLILRYMIDRTKEKDDKNVKEACNYWMFISKEQPDIYINIVFPYLCDIISSLADKLIYTQEDLISTKNGHASRDYPFFIDSDSIRMYCVHAIRSIALGFKNCILPGVVQIINGMVSDTDLKIQEVAIVLLGCIAESRECRETITPYLETTFNKLTLLNNYFIPGESLFRDKLLWTLVAYRDYIVHQPQYMIPLMTYMLRSEIKKPLHYPFLEGEAFWNLVTDENLSSDAFRPYLTNVLSIIFRGLYYYKTRSPEEVKYDTSTDRCTRNDSIDAINNLIWIYKGDILPIIMPLIDECIASDETYSKESGIVALRLIAKGGIGDMVTELPKYLEFMVNTLVDYNRILSAASCITLGRFHDMIVNRSSHDKYLVPLMEYLLSTETEYISSDPYTLSCVLFTLQTLIFDKPNAQEIFAPYLTRIVTNMCKAIIYSDEDVIALQGDDVVDEYYMDCPMIVCKQYTLNFEDNNDKEPPSYKSSSYPSNRGRAAYILYDIIKIYKCSVLPIIMPIIQIALKSDNWKVLESGIFAFGIINRDKHMDDAITNVEWFPYLNKFFYRMMDNLSNKRPIIRANTMVTISRYSFNIINKSHKEQLLPLMRMIAARVFDSNMNVRTTAWQVWNIFMDEVTHNDPVLKWYMDHTWKVLTDMVECYRRIQQGQVDY